MSTEVSLRARILAEATDLFARKGFGGAAVRELAAAVGVTKPTLYYHYGSKEQLYLATVNAHVEAATRAIEEAVAGPGSVRARLNRFVQTQCRFVQENAAAVRLLITCNHEPAAAGAPPVDLMTMHRHHAELLHGLLQDGVRSGELRPDLDLPTAVLAFLGMVHLPILAALHGAPLPLGDAHAHSIVDLFYRGVHP